MAVSQDEENSSPITPQDLRDLVLPRNSKKWPIPLPHTRNIDDEDLVIKESGSFYQSANSKNHILNWPAYIGAIFLFILNLAVQSLFDLSKDTSNIVNITVVILIVSGIAVFHYFKGGKNG